MLRGRRLAFQRYVYSDDVDTALATYHTWETCMVSQSRDRQLVVITRPIIPERVLASVRAIADVQVWPSHDPPSPEQLRRFSAGASGIITMAADPVDTQFLSSAPKLRVVSNFAVGFDNLDLAALSQRRIPAGHTPDAVTNATADLTWALLLASARHLPAAEQFVRRGEWDSVRYDRFLGLELDRARLGIIGFGRIGRAVARRAAGFGMEVVYHSRRHAADKLGEWLPLDELLATSDVVTLHLALTPSTRQIIGEREIGLMKPSAILVNASRGGLIDQDALAQALVTGSIGGAGLDVLAVEPPRASTPVLSAPNCIITPHIGSATARSRLRMAQTAVENLLAGLEDRPLPHCVNPEVYAPR